MIIADLPTYSTDLHTCVRYYKYKIVYLQLGSDAYLNLVTEIQVSEHLGRVEKYILGVYNLTLGYFSGHCIRYCGGLLEKYPKLRS